MSASGGALRRVRSVDGLPCCPERAHIYSSLRASRSTSNHHDFDINEASPWPPPRLDMNAKPSLPTLPARTTTPDHQDPPPQPPNTSLHVKVLTFFGRGQRATRARKSLVSLIWNVSWGFIQFVVIVTMLILTGTHFKSRSDPNLSEWTACERPLGVWASIWIIRVLLVSSLACRDFRRDRVLRSQSVEIEAGVTNPATQPEIPTLRHELVVVPYSVMILSWFLTAHILEYTSINTCRHSSPHLWWLMFSILCTMYLMDLEVVFMGLGVVLYIVWSIFLLCIGRNPFQPKPQVGKLPKTVVERIPLVTYIPPPPEGVKSALVHSYPPTNTPTFDEKNGGTTDKEGSLSWEAHWETCEYPFITLEGNRATCAICFMDFKEPKRKEEISGEASSNPAETEHGTNDVMVDSHIPSEEADQEGLRLVDAGDGVQPLRLLTCSHVFHKTCLDPWLIGVSGRCPVCQRAVEIPKRSKKNPQRTS